MAKFIQSARSFFDDEEIEKLLLNSPPFSRRRLEKIARSRGLYLSNDLSREDYVRRLSKLRYSWSQFLELAGELNTNSPEERRSVKRLNNIPDSGDFLTVAKLVSKERGELKDENYTIEKKPTGEVSLKIVYVERDPKKAKWGQKERKEINIDISKNEDGLVEMLYNDDKKAKEIIGDISSTARKVLSKSDDDQIKEKIVSLMGKNPEERTKFFFELMNDLPKYKLDTVQSVKLDRRLEDGGNKESSAKELEQVIKTAAFTGDQVTETKLYKDLTSQGYYIAFVKWIIQDTKNLQSLFVLEAGFSEPITGEGFFFDAKKSADYAHPKGYEYSTISSIARKKLRHLISEKAFSLTK